MAGFVYNKFMLAWLRVLGVVLVMVSAATSAFSQGGVLRVGVPSVPSELDPATALEGSVPLIARQVFDTLVQYTAGSSDIEPALAAQWSVSKDGLVWSFRLRPGTSFHDGTPVSAQHVVDSLQREIFPGHPQSPGGEAVVARLLRGQPGIVREVRAKDPRTVDVVLTQPYAPLLTLLAHPVFSVVLPAGGSGNRWQGTGPFGIAEIAPGRIVLDARPSYWGRRPRLGRITFIETGDDAQGEAALGAQSLDVFFPGGVPPRVPGAVSVPGWRVGYLTLQTEKEPFRRVKARQGVAIAVDPVLLAPALGQAATPLQAFLPRGVWARREGPPLMAADPERAKRLFGEAGLGASSSATLLISEARNRVDQAKLAEALRASLAAAGLAVTIRAAPAETALSLMQTGEHQMALAEAWIEAGDPHFLLYPTSSSEGATKGGGATNFSFYRNQRLDDLLIRASQLFFRPERERLYLRAQAMLAEDLPWIPIYTRLVWAVARPEVKELRLHPSGSPRLDRTWMESQGSAPPAPGN
jgi:peptide/nickel transport system substrate-binding protein